MITAMIRSDGRRSGPPRTKCCNRAAVRSSGVVAPVVAAD
jgi:hypothetical protein